MLTDNQKIEMLIKICGAYKSIEGNETVIRDPIWQNEWASFCVGRWTWASECPNLHSTDDAVEWAEKLGYEGIFDFGKSIRKYRASIHHIPLRKNEPFSINYQACPAHALWLALLEAVNNDKK